LLGDNDEEAKEQSVLEEAETEYWRRFAESSIDAGVDNEETERNTRDHETKKKKQRR
jgi:hypothetical protein